MHVKAARRLVSTEGGSTYQGKGLCEGCQDIPHIIKMQVEGNIQNGILRGSSTLGAFGWTACPLPCDITLVTMPHPSCTPKGGRTPEKGKAQLGFKVSGRTWAEHS